MSLFVLDFFNSLSEIPTVYLDNDSKTLQLCKMVGTGGCLGLIHKYPNQTLTAKFISDDLNITPPKDGDIEVDIPDFEDLKRSMMINELSIALGRNSISDVCKSYDLTKNELEDLLSTPSFSLDDIPFFVRSFGG